MSEVPKEGSEEIDPDMTVMLINTFQVFLHSFLVIHKKSSFGPTDHIQMSNEENGLHVSFTMRENGNIEMRTTVPSSYLTKYMSLRQSEDEPEKNTLN